MSGITLEERVANLELVSDQQQRRLIGLTDLVAAFVTELAIDRAYSERNPDEWARGFIEDVHNRLDLDFLKRSRGEDWKAELHAEVDRLGDVMIELIRSAD